MFASVESMARTYIALIRTVQPHGPYRLAGWSAGGLIAHEMGRQLRAQGEDVQFVAMIDSYAFSGVAPQPHLSRAEELILHLRRENPNADPALLDALAHEADVATLVRQAHALGLVQGSSADDAAHRFEVAFAIGEAVTRHVPVGWEGNVLQFTADERLCDAHGTPLPDHGWARLGDHAPTVIPIGGTHLSILRPPHLNKLVRELGRLLAHS